MSVTCRSVVFLPYRSSLALWDDNLFYWGPSVRFSDVPHQGSILKLQMVPLLKQATELWGQGRTVTGDWRFCL